MCSDRSGAAEGSGPGPAAPVGGAEDVQPAFPELRDRIRAELPPRNRVEAGLVDRIAGLTWRLSRTAGLEIALLLMDYHSQEVRRTHESYGSASIPGGGPGDLGDGPGRPPKGTARDRQDPVGQGQSIALAFVTGSRSLARLKRYEAATLANLEKCLRLLREWQDGGAQPSPEEASPR